MAIFRKVHTEFWTDPKVLEEMTPEDKYFMLYLLTNSNTTQVGIYQISKKTIAFELGYSPESINALMDRFINNHKLIKYNDETREVAIKNWGKFNLDRAGKPMEDCVRSQLEDVKDESFIEYVGESVKSAKLKALYDTYTSSTQEQEQEQEEEQEQEQQQEEQEKIVNTEIIKDVVVVLDNKITVQEAKTILKAASGNIELIKAKYEIAKVSNYESFIGFMIRAIENNYQMPTKQKDKPKSKVNTKFHNFEQRTSNYSDGELNEIIRRQSEAKIKKRLKDNAMQLNHN